MVFSVRLASATTRFAVSGSRCRAAHSAEGTTDLKLRARQNVVFEHGFLINKLGRKRVVALVDDGVETPGDLSGVVYIHFSDTDWKNQVMREINSCGIPIDPFNA